jgi:hypothetical protein
MDDVRPQLAHTKTFAALVLSAALVFSLACSDHKAKKLDAAPAASQGEGGAPYSLDSALTLFRKGMEPVAVLENGATSIDELFTRFVRMAQQRDTATLRAMTMNRREFAYLYYPTSPFTRAPMKQDPALVWFLHINSSQKGAARLLERFGGRPIRFVDNTCKEPPRVEGDNRLWADCIQRFITGRDTTTIRLFGGVYERSGRFKIFSYANDL